MATAGYLTPQQLRNGSADAKTLDKFGNDPAGVPNINRVGNDVENMMTLRQRMLDAASDVANRKTYVTVAAMMADTTQPIDTPARVETGEGAGDYIMTASGWIWSDVQPASSAKLDTALVRMDDSSVPVVTTSRLVPLLADQAGNVPLWTEGDRVVGVGILRTASANVNNVAVPLVVDDQNNVGAWLEYGALAAKALAPRLLDQVSASVSGGFAPRNAPLGSEAPRSTDGRTLYEARAQLAKALRAQPGGVCRILLVGDSWAQLSEIARATIDILYARYEFSATGWVPTYPQYPLNGTTVARSGTWTLYDASNETTPPPYGCGIDGHGFYTSGVNGAWSVTNCLCTEFTYFYWDATGSFRYRLDGGAWTTVVGGGTNTLKTIEFTGLADAPHSFEMDNSVNTGGGVVTLLGGYATRNAVPGVEFSKCGNGGQTGARMLNITGHIAAYAQVMKPNVVVMILGTNDYRQTFSTVAAYKQALQMWVDEVRSVRLGCSFIFFVPPQSDAPVIVPLAEYRDAARDVAVANNAEFLNGLDDWGAFAETSALGLWTDALHPNADGAEIIAQSLTQRFFTF